MLERRREIGRVEERKERNGEEGQNFILCTTAAHNKTKRQSSASIYEQESLKKEKKGEVEAKDGVELRKRRGIARLEKTCGSSLGFEFNVHPE